MRMSLFEKKSIIIKKSKNLNLSWPGWPAVLLAQAGEPDPHARGRENDEPQPPHPQAAVEWSSTSGAVKSKHSDRETVAF